MSSQNHHHNFNHHHQHHHQQQHQQQQPQQQQQLPYLQQHQIQNQDLQNLQYSYDTSSLDLFPEIIFPQQASFHSNTSSNTTAVADTTTTATTNSQLPNRLTAAQSQHSNSSSETLIGSHSHFGSTDSIVEQQRQQQFKQEDYLSSDTASTNPGSCQSSVNDFFERSTSEDIGLLTLRSSSDPTIALHSFQSRQQSLREEPLGQQQNNITEQTAASILHSSLPSFQETYSIKYNQQLSNLGLKMDEDCYNISSPHHPTSVSSYHHGHGHHPAAFNQDHYADYQQHTGTGQFMTPAAGSFYQYDQATSNMVS